MRRPTALVKGERNIAFVLERCEDVLMGARGQPKAGPRLAGTLEDRGSIQLTPASFGVYRVPEARTMDRAQKATFWCTASAPASAPHARPRGGYRRQSGSPCAEVLEVRTAWRPRVADCLRCLSRGTERQSGWWLNRPGFCWQGAW